MPDRDAIRANCEGGRWYLVESPVYDHGGDYYEPPEPQRDFALVKAPNSTKAKWAAWKLWKKNPRLCDWPYWSDGAHPLSGLTARRWESIGEGIDPIPSEKDLEAWQPFVAEVCS